MKSTSPLVRSRSGRGSVVPVTKNSANGPFRALAGNIAGETGETMDGNCRVKSASSLKTFVAESHCLSDHSRSPSQVFY